MQNIQNAESRPGNPYTRVPETFTGMRITETARSLGTTPRALRFYEELGLVSVTRTPGGGRRYGWQAREQLKLIVTLRKANIPLNHIKNVLDGGPQVQRDLLRQRLVELEAERESLLDTLSMVESAHNPCETDLLRQSAI